MTCKHQIIQSEIEEMNKKMNILFSKTSEWNIVFESAKEQIKLREEKRKIYDHYEGKLSKLNKNNKKDQKYIEKNEEKYTKVASEYVEIYEKAFNTINNSLKVAYELTNPIIDEIITNEKNLFQGIGQSLSCFTNNNERFKEIKNNSDNQNINKDSIIYDPIKYMNEKDLMKKISLSRNMKPNLIPAKKRSSEPNTSEILFKKSNNNTLPGRLSVMVNNKDNNINFKNYDNILTNLKMTNSFGNIIEEELSDFYSFEDDFQYSLLLIIIIYNL